MKKKTLFILILFIYTNLLFAQLSSVHYLPPLKQGANNQAIKEQAFYLSTPETLAFNINVFQGTNTTAVSTLNISNTSPGQYNIANGDNNITLVTNANTGIPLSNSGLRFESVNGEKFYVNYRGRSQSQATSLTSKGDKALGTSFKWGGRPNYGNGHTSLNATLGIMATQDGTTTINIFNYGSDCEFRLQGDDDGITDNSLTVTLTKGQTYVLEAYRNATIANIDCWLGASIQSDKKIAISNGNLNGAPRVAKNSRDASIDQPVPENLLGRDYIFIRGNGVDDIETPIIIATQNNTDILVNNVIVKTLNTGEYYVIDGSNYTPASAGGNMYVTTTKEVYAYQYLSGASGIHTGGLNFIAPVNCLLPDKLSNISNIKDVDGKNFNGGITIIASTSTPNANIIVTDDTGVKALINEHSLGATPDWKTFYIPNLTGNVSVESTGPIAVGFLGVSGAAGIAGYFSGFDTVPVVELDITGGGCLPGADVFEVSANFDAYQWFQNGVEMLGANTNAFTPTEPGAFYVRVTKGTCTYNSAVLPVYNCDPEILIKKTVDTSPVIEGDVVTFTITVQHLGINPVTNLVIEDLLPSELNFQTVTPSFGTWTAPNWIIGDMFSGEMYTLIVKATVNEVPAGITVTNTINNTQTEVEADILTDDPTEDITIINNELTITKTDQAPTDGSYDTVGEKITYNFVVTNTGSQIIPNVTISDINIDAGSLSPTSVSNLAIGAVTNFTATHTITQADIEADQVINTATVQGTLSNGFIISSTSDDPDTGTLGDATITPIDQKGELVLEKIAQPALDGLYDTLGEEITYELTVKNTGNVSLNNITITDLNIDVGSLTPATIANLPAGASAIFTAKHTIVQVDFDNGNVTNTATVSGTEVIEGTLITDTSDDPTTIALNDPTIVTVPQFGQLEVTKISDNQTNGPYNTLGQTIKYTIIAKSIGNVTLTNINVVDPNADTVILINTTGTDTATDNIVDSMMPNDTATFEATHVITQEDLDNAQVINTATVGAQDPSMGSVTDLSDDPTDNTTTTNDPTIVPLISVPEISVTKTADDDSNVKEGQIITYTYTITNTGNVTFDDISLSDIHSGTGTLGSITLQSTTGIDDGLDNIVNQLAPTLNAIWTATYTITSSDITNQTDITNTVTVSTTPKTGTITSSDLIATEVVTVNPEEIICSNTTLAHNLTADVNPSVTSFSWSATDTPYISGETSTTSTNTNITDTLINIGTTNQDVVYTIIAKNASNDVVDTYTYKVTVQPSPNVLNTNQSLNICTGGSLNENLSADIDNFNSGVTFSWSATDNSNITGETTTTSTSNKVEDTLINTSTSPQDVVYTITPTATINNCTGSIYTITVTVAPSIILPTDGTSTVSCIANATQPTAPIVNDINGNPITPVISQNTSPTCEGEKIYTYTYTDCSGNVSIYKFTYTIDLITAPIISTADGQSDVECLADATTPTPPTGIVDTCGNTVNAVLVSIIDTPNPITCEGTRVYNYTYTDCSGLVTPWKYTYIIDLITTPIISTADGQSDVECLADTTTPTPPTGIVDACGNSVIAVLVSTIDTPNSITCEGTRVYNYTYTDCSGLVTPWKYTYTIDLITAPIISTADGQSDVECLADATTPTPPTGIVDTCGNTVNAVLVSTIDTPNPITCEGTRVYNYTYTDCSGLVTPWKYTYTIDLITAPIISTADGQSDVECLADATTPTPPTGIVGACGNSVIAVLVSTIDTPNSITCEGTRVYNYTYTDCSGLVTPWKYTYTIDLITAPIISTADGQSDVECLADATTPTPPTGIVGACGNSVIAVLVSTIDTPNSITCEGTRVYNYTYTDCSGLVTPWKYTYTIDLITAPIISTADGQSDVECLADATTPTPPTGIVDACGNTVNPVLVSTIDTPNPITCEGTRVYNYTYTDCSGLVTPWKYTYTIDLITAPIISAADGESDVECLADATTPTPPTGIVDACGNTVNPVLVSTIDTPNSITCEGTRVYNYTYTDCSGLVTPWKYTYTIDLITAPIISTADGQSDVECLADTTTPTPPTGIVGACGNTVNAVLVSTIDTPNPITCEGTRVYNYTYTDCSGLVTPWKYTYTIDLITAPIISTADGQSDVECLADATTPTPPTGIVDTCGNTVNAVLVSTIDTPNPITCEGTRVYNYTYTDCSGLVTPWKYTYTIDLITAPIISTADGQSDVECLADATTPTPPTGIVGACGNSVIAVLVSTIDTPNSITCEGTRVYNYTYTDCSGLVTPWKYTYTIDLITAPIISTADGQSDVECLADATTPTPPTGIVDACGNTVNPVLVSTIDTPNPITCEGTRVYNYTYTDCSGLVTPWKYTYTIDLITAPIISAADGESDVECLADATTPTPPTGIVDACGNTVNPVLVSTIDTPNSITCEGTRVYNYTYTDCSGLVTPWKYTYTIDLITAPIISTADGQSDVECLADTTTPTPPTGIVGACGNTVNAVLVSTIDTPNPITCEGTRVYNYTYTDCSGLVTPWKYTYTIDLITAPIISTADGQSDVECLADATTPTPPTGIVDTCGNTVNAVLVSTIDTPNPITCEGTRVYNYTYTDCSGLVTPWKYTYTIDLITAPIISTADGQSDVECLADATPPTPPTGIVDTCGNSVIAVLVSTIDTPNPITCEGTRVYNYTYTDCSGLVTSWKYTYTIDLTTAPIISTADGQSDVECLADATTPTPPTGIKDACGNSVIAVLVSTIDTPNPITCEGTRVYNYTYTDCSGLVTPWKYTYTIDLITAPIISTADGQSDVECLADATTPTPPTGIVNTCGNTVNPVLVSTIDTPNSITCEGTRVYNYTYTDCSGLVTPWKYTYTIDIPTFTINQANGTSTVNNIIDAVQPTTPIVEDVCGNNIIPVITENATPICDGTKTYTFTYTDCSGNTDVYTYTYTIDVTSTLNIADTSKIICSNTSLTSDLTNLTSITGVTFEWLATTNPNISGALNGNGTILNDTLINISGNNQDIIYTITPFNSDGCKGDTFKYTVTVNPEPFNAIAPTDTTCSGIPLNHDLKTNVNITNTTFSWVASQNTNVTGQTTTVSNTTSITDTLINTTQNTQTVIYTITPTSNNGCVGIPYTYSVNVTPKTDIAVTKIAISALDGSYNLVGEIIEYQITVQNKTNTDINNISITDENANTGSITPSLVTTIAPLGSTIFNASHTITQADLDAGKVINSAIATVSDSCGTITTSNSDDPNTVNPNDDTITLLDQNPSISFDKIVTFNDENNDGTPQQGETLTYNFTVTNTGNVTLSSILINDPLITVNGSLTSLAPQVTNTTSFFATYTITQANIDAGSITNSATITATSPSGTVITDTSDDPNDSTNNDINEDGEPDDTTIFTFIEKPILTLSKTGVFIDANGDNLAQVGETIIYTFDVTNTGNVTISDILITDPIVAVTGNAITLAPNQTNSTAFTANYVLTQNDINNGTITNTATVSGTSPNGTIITDTSDDPTTTADNDATITTLSQNSQLSLLKTAQFNDENQNGFPNEGETITYIFDIRNTGNVSITNIIINDPKATVNGGSIDLAPNQTDNTTFTATYTITLADINSGNTTNSATVSGTNPSGNSITDISDDPTNTTNIDLNSDGDSDDATITTLIPNPKMSVTKTGVFQDENNDGITQVGETILYTFNVSNTGNVTISDIIITDPLVTVSGTPITLNPLENNSTMFTAVYTINQLDIDTATISNTAIVNGQSPNGDIITDTSDDPNNDTNNDTNGDGEPDDTTITTLPIKGSISLTKESLPATDLSYDTVGEKIIYQLIVTNTGNTTLKNINITDSNADLGSITPATISEIIPGASTIINAEHTITKDDLNNGFVTNTASVTATDPSLNIIEDTSDDPNNTTDNDTNNDGEPDDITNTVLSQKPSISLEKTAIFNDENDDNFPQIGETITYNFNVTNTGNITINNITVTDALVAVNGGPITLTSAETNSNTFYAEYVITQSDIDLGIITNTATVNGEAINGNNVTDTSDDPNNTTNNDINNDGEPDDTTSTTLPNNPELTLFKTGVFIDTNNDGSAQVGEQIKYIFDVSNTGNVTISNINITDAIVTVSGNPITLIPGETNSTTFTAIYTLTLADVNAGNIINTATVNGTTPSGNNIVDNSDDPTTTDNNDATITTLIRTPKLELYKVGTFNDENGDGNPQTGETISYTFDIRNVGNVTITNIIITDPIVTVSGGAITLNPSEMNNTHFSAIYTITQQDIDAGSLTNTALATGLDTDGVIVSDVSDYSDDPNNPNNIDLNGDGDPDDPTVTNLTGNPQLNLIKTAIFNDIDGNGFANVGETINYTFTVTNSGNLTISNINISDPLVNVSGMPITLLPSETDNTTFSATYTLTQFDLDKGTITNSAIVKGQDPNGTIISDTSDDPNNSTNVDNNNDGNPDDATVSILNTKESISITKETLPATDGAYDSIDEQINYAIVITNTGNVTLSNIVISDINADAGSIFPDTIPTLAPGESINVVAIHTITQTDLNTGVVLNTATVNAVDTFGNTITDTSDDPNNSTDNDTNGDGEPDDTTSTTMIQTPAISLIKSADTAPDGLWNAVGEVITYTLVAVNTGNVTLSNIIISDTNADTGSVLPNNIASIAPGEQVVITASHTITQDELNTGYVTNTAIVTAQDTNGNSITDESDDPNNPTNNDTNGDGEPDDATITLTPQSATINVTKSVDKISYTNIGEILTYNITITNNGNVTLLNLIISDANAIITSANTIPSLAPGEVFVATAEHIITIDDINNEYVSNTAYVSGTVINSTDTIKEDSDDIDDLTNTDIDNDGDFEDPTISIFNGSSDLSITKTVDNLNPIVNSEVEFTITLTNKGTVTANNINIKEVIPSGYKFISYTSSVGSYSDTTGNWNVPTINSGDNETLYIIVEVLGIGDYINTATISNFEGANDSDTQNDTAYAVAAPKCLEVYNIFTPNNDGGNDSFVISCIEKYPNNTLEVFNRWGNTVFKVKGYKNNWKGISNGRVNIQKSKKLPVGTYYYVLDLGNDTEPKVGWIYINR
ncbi:HYR-like domain-containing protein [Tenacibaculum salmonis]|uniref:HYR-like domain-containing protein n=1 Tax=Tenacibaculum sp. P3-BQ1 TaxID=3232310 RepID=UPI0034DF0536